ncbi:MAG: hypothetical protein L3J52_07455 [Proteobacteria bacterium]|nr:hypothetical protein [Pseudomonadota bacterium]
MKKIIVLILMISASNVLATDCGDFSLNSVGGDTTDGYDNNTTSAMNSFSSDSDAQINCDSVELPPITVVGYYIPSSYGWSNLIWGWNMPSGGGGSVGGISANQPPTNDDFGCSNSTEQERLGRAGRAYNVLLLWHRARAAGGNIMSLLWIARNGTNSLWTTEWPDGSSSTMIVKGPGTSAVFLAEESNSCGG